jgi:hypothetical protein
VRSAREYLIALLRIMEDSEVQNIRLEEVEYDTDKQDWLVTLGYDRPITDPLRTSATRHRRAHRARVQDAHRRWPDRPGAEHQNPQAVN